MLMCRTVKTVWLVEKDVLTSVAMMKIKIKDKNTFSFLSKVPCSDCYIVEQAETSKGRMMSGRTNQGKTFFKFFCCLDDCAYGKEGGFKTLRGGVGIFIKRYAF
jgi:hypothetical protein